MTSAVAEPIAALGGYRFDAYKTDPGKLRATRVVVSAPELPTESDQAAVAAIGSATALVKDLVHIPAEWLGPQDFADRAV
ncbi:MAG: leucyl aminopeptidase, partial [Microbacterium sp.]